MMEPGDVFQTFEGDDPFNKSLTTMQYYKISVMC